MRTTWDEQEFPLLTWLAENGRSRRESVIVRCCELGLERSEVGDMLLDLAQERYVELDGVRSVEAFYSRAESVRLGVEGRRLLGLWPTSTGAAERLVEALLAEAEQRATDAATDEERASWRALVSAIGGITTSVAASVLASAASRQLGL